MAFPYKCLVARNFTTASNSSDWILFAASGSRIVVQSSKGAASIWPEQDAQSRVSESMEFLAL
jgi:tRNA (guanine-N(7)-)-methyltransferase subunit TRM82